MVENKDLKEWVEVIHSLIVGVEPMPDLEDLEAVKAYFKRAPDLAENGLKSTVKDMCDMYLEEL